MSRHYRRPWHRRLRRWWRRLSRRERQVMLAVAAGVLLAVLAHGATSAPPATTTAQAAAAPTAQAAAAPASVSGSVALGERMAASGYGWTGGQWDCLYALWERESGWSRYADTRQSGLDAPGASVFAYGIAQARPATKMPLAGQPADLGGHSDPQVQVEWGLGYIQATYGSPCGAWAHEEADSWY